MPFSLWQWWAIMNNPLVGEAQRLARGGDFEPSGQLPLVKRSTHGEWAGLDVTVLLNFSGQQELLDAVSWAIRNGYKPLNLNPVQPPAPMRPTDIVGHAPTCPIHRCAMKPSRKPGEYYCPTRVDGGWCKEKAKA